MRVREIKFRLLWMPQVDLIYPPDSTPPHVLTVKTL
ncbi:MAG: DUF3370 family protein [Calothrix sp. SM1_7_51]|nr:DUF3370 family protein [Calothrix sp. SM1_7_51]